MNRTVTSEEIHALDQFLKNRGIDYVLTGSCALFYHGALPEGMHAHDIDIIVLTTPENRAAAQSLFKELETLSGGGDNDYPDTNMYTFKVGKNYIPVNAFEGDVLGCSNNHPKNHTFIIDGAPIKVHNVLDILRAKFSLNRVKDHEYFAKIVNQLSNMFPNV